MSWVFTPKQLSARAELYHQLHQLLAAGVPMLQSLEMAQRSRLQPSVRRPLTRIHERIAQGATFSEAVRTQGKWMTAFDLALVDAGEKSGRLPEALKLLADDYRERASLVRQGLVALAYPVSLFHFAVLISPFPELFLTGNLQNYAVKTMGVLLPIYAAVACLAVAAQGRHGEWWRLCMEKLARAIPVLGAARRSLALARLASALEALINAGVPMVQAWDLAAAASGSPALKRAVQGWPGEMVAGQTPAELVSRCREFPEFFAQLYQTGEISGQLDDSLARLRAHYQEEGQHKLRLLADWVPKLVYFIILLLIAWQVVSFWRGYFGKIEEAIKFNP